MSALTAELPALESREYVELAFALDQIETEIDRVAGLEAEVAAAEAEADEAGWRVGAARTSAEQPPPWVAAARELEQAERRAAEIRSAALNRLDERLRHLTLVPSSPSAPAPAPASAPGAPVAGAARSTDAHAVAGCPRAVRVVGPARSAPIDVLIPAVALGLLLLVVLLWLG